MYLATFNTSQATTMSTGTAYVAVCGPPPFEPLIAYFGHQSVCTCPVRMNNNPNIQACRSLALDYKVSLGQWFDDSMYPWFRQ